MMYNSEQLHTSYHMIDYERLEKDIVEVSKCLNMLIQNQANPNQFDDYIQYCKNEQKLISTQQFYPMEYIIGPSQYLVVMQDRITSFDMIIDAAIIKEMLCFDRRLQFIKQKVIEFAEGNLNDKN